MTEMDAIGDNAEAQAISEPSVDNDTGSTVSADVIDETPPSDASGTTADGATGGTVSDSSHTPETGSREPVNHSVVLVSQLTGARSAARTDERWNVFGTDLGFSFEHQGTMYMVFGDTWGRGGTEGVDWRSNVMAIAEPDPHYGYVLTGVVGDASGEAKELLPSLKQPGTEYTVIPTAGIAIDNRMYLHYMSIRDWEPSATGYKHPAVNGAGFAYSDDQGQTWFKDETAAWSGDTAFTQAAMVEDGEHVYVFGTPAGRFGSLKLLRVPRDSLLRPEQYGYWSGADWSPDASDAAEVVPAPVGELSVRWSPFHERWLMMYRNEVDDAIVMRTADQLTGTWDDERVVLTGAEYPTNYAPFMFPISGPDVHFAMSIFRPDYQVYIMRLTLDP